MRHLISVLLILPVFVFGQRHSIFKKTSIDTPQTVVDTICTLCKVDSSKFEFSIMDSSKGNKSELFINTKSWLTNAFVSSKAVIEMEDKEAGKIIGKAIIKLSDGITSAHFTITIDVKDNKYRCKLTDFLRYVYDAGVSTLTVNGGSFTKMEESGFMKNSINKKTKQVRDETIRRSLLLLESLNKFMSTANKSDF